MSVGSAPFDTLDTWREAIAMCACRARVYADMADQYAAIGDDVGLRYAVRCLVAATKAAADLTLDLHADKDRLRAERDEAVARTGTRA